MLEKQQEYEARAVDPQMTAAALDRARAALDRIDRMVRDHPDTSQGGAVRQVAREGLHSTGLAAGVEQRVLDGLYGQKRPESKREPEAPAQAEIIECGCSACVVRRADIDQCQRRIATLRGHLERHDAQEAERRRMEAEREARIAEAKAHARMGAAGSLGPCGATLREALAVLRDEGLLG
jgi:hypothetical protein